MNPVATPGLTTRWPGSSPAPGGPGTEFDVKHHPHPTTVRVGTENQRKFANKEGR